MLCVINFKKITMAIIGVTITVVIMFCSIILIIKPKDGVDTGQNSNPSETDSKTYSPSQDINGSGGTEELRGMWISYLDLSPIMTNKTETQFRNGFKEMVKTISDFGFTAIFVHVRPFGDALYNSDYYPYSHLLSGVQGHDPGYDPLEIMIEYAGAVGLEVHAWINPYRISSNDGAQLSADNMAYTWYNDVELYKNYVENVDGKLYYNPGITEVCELIVDGVAEIVERYNIDGIHFDDYFYPTASESFDKYSYDKFISENDVNLTLSDYRLMNVSNMLKSVYTAVKEINKDVVFGVSPQGNIDINYSSQFADVKMWMATDGYIDYICPQIYFGFEHETKPFDSTVLEWASLPRHESVTLYIGITAHKIGIEDTWAGESAKTEWQNSDDMLSRMVDTTRQQDDADGFILYSYKFLFTPGSDIEQLVMTERDKLEQVIK